ncbi:MAG: von Willebrand factor type A domain-containing protein, partial [Myxococcales bacterium]|nr:von Willebrand factor type A domain-containing protein [Myxococcales bacterium]
STSKAQFLRSGRCKVAAAASFLLPMTHRSLRSAATVLPLLVLAACGGSKDMYGTAPKSAAPASPAAEYAPDAQKLADAPPAPPPPPAQPGAVAPSEVALATTAPEPRGTEGFKDYGVNPFVDTTRTKLSTFSIDVDTASYSFARRNLLQENRLPAFAGVRAEEFLNSFDYGYEAPAPGRTFAVHFAAAPSPYTPGRHLVRVGVQAKRVTAAERSPVHLVYLVDTSGSMGGADRIELAKKSLHMLTESLKPGDTVALCTYAGDTRVVLEPSGDRRAIHAAINGLTTGGGTAMGSGMELAYKLASKTLAKGHVNRVVVLSDGDANIGHASHEQILASIARYRDQGITLSTVGFGSGNYQDTMMEQLADKGDGNYSYIDDEAQARKVFVEQVDGLLQVVARDVKIQVELDPNVVRRYRLVGYENRHIDNKDFRNDKVDAGEVGAGHAVTALYEVELARTDQSPITLRLRHKPAKNAANGGSDKATEERFAMPVKDVHASFAAAPESYRFAVAVAGFAEVLRESPHAAEWRLSDVAKIAQVASGTKPERRELVGLVVKA